ncbi:MAG: AI-2E family transporter, partial [Algiphilus sp.]
MKPITDWFQQQLSNPQVISLLLVLLLFWALVTFLPGTFMPVFAAVVIAYLLEGPTGTLERILPRWAASMLVWTIFVTVAMAGLFTILPLLTRQITQLITEIPAVIRALQTWMMTLPEEYPNIFSAQQLQEFADGLNINFSRLSDEVLARSYMVGTGITLAMIYGVLVPLMVLFLLKDKTRILRWMRGFLPRDISLIQS